MADERARLHVLPEEPYAAALGETRAIADDQTVRFGSVRYSTPPGHVGTAVWCRVHGDKLIVTAREDRGLREIARYRPLVPLPAVASASRWELPSVSTT